MAWAFRQKLPPKPKIVLLALADQTDETTGRVCYGKTDIKHLAQKCSVGERSLYRYLAALIRNGYAIRESGKDRGHESLFWLCLDRPPSILEEWQWKIIPSEDDDEPDYPDDDAQDVEGGSANLAEGPEVENVVEPAQNGRGGLPQGGRPRVFGIHQNIRSDSLNEQESAFSRKAQDLEREAVAIRKSATTQNASVFVIYGTRAWDAWISHRRANGQIPSMPTCNGTGENAGKRGWYLPSLFPPSASGTDPPNGLTEEDARELIRNR